MIARDAIDAKNGRFVLGLLVLVVGSCGACSDSTLTGQSAKARDTESQVRDAASGAKCSDSLRQAAVQRDPQAAQELAAKYFSDAKTAKDRKPDVLLPSELIRILVLDYDMPEYHVQLAESHLADLGKTDDASVPAAESIWQQLEWLRLRNVDGALSGRVADLKKRRFRL